MSTELNDKAAVEQELWEAIEETRFGMLAPIAPAADHFQPMTSFPEPEGGKIWFYTRRTADIAVASEGGVEAMYVFMSKDRKMQASIRGRLRSAPDTVHRDKYWNPVVAAWYPDGKDDAELTMLCFDCEDAHVWVTANNPVQFGWEIAKANLTHTTPDLGGKVKLSLE